MAVGGSMAGVSGQWDELKQAITARGIVFAPLFYYLCIVLSVVASWPLRSLRGTTAHCFAAASGLAIVALALGPLGILNVIMMVAYSYGLMLVARRYCGLTVFAAAFAHLLYCHVHNASGESRNQGEMDYTGTLMVLCLKVISVAFNYQDGLLGEEKLSKSQTSRVVRKLPALHEYLGYIFMGGSLLAGPVYEFRDYDDFVRRRGVWAPSAKQPPALLPTAASFCQSLVAAVLTVTLAPLVPLDSVLKPAYLTAGYAYKIVYLFPYCFVNCRLRFYSAFFMSEAGYRASGFAFNGYTSDGKPRWDRTLNVRPLAAELCTSAALLPQVWNVGTSKWLRAYVYERLAPSNGKPTLFTLLATQLVSGAWHGLYPGFLLCFLFSAGFLHVAKSIHKWRARLPAVMRPPATVLLWAYTQAVMNYHMCAFILLDWAKIDTVASSLYYGPTVLILGLLLVFAVLPPPPREREGGAAKKDE